MDFMSDSMVGNRKFRTFNVIDDCSREVLAIEVDTSLSARRIVRTLERIIDERGTPKLIRTEEKGYLQIQSTFSTIQYGCL